MEKACKVFSEELKLRNLNILLADEYKLRKQLALVCKQNGYTNHLQKVMIKFTRSVNYIKGELYYDKDDSETETHLFYGKKPAKYEMKLPGFKRVAVKAYTYGKLADIIARNFFNDNRIKNCLNRGYTDYGCSCYLESKTLNRRKIPIIKSVFILGGKRITF